MRFPLVPYLLVTLFSVKTSVSFCGLFVGEIFFFKNDAALLLGSRSANANVE